MHGSCANGTARHGNAKRTAGAAAALRALHCLRRLLSGAAEEPVKNVEVRRAKRVKALLHDLNPKGRHPGSAQKQTGLSLEYSLHTRSRHAWPS